MKMFDLASKGFHVGIPHVTDDSGMKEKSSDTGA